MLRYWTLAALPLALLAAMLLVWSFVPADARPAVLAGSVASAKVLAIVGCMAAAWAFDPGDYLRRAWLLLAA